MRRWWVILLCVLIGAGLHLLTANDGWQRGGAMVGAAAATKGPVPWPRSALLPQGSPPFADTVTVHRRFGLSEEVWRARRRGISYSVHRADWGWPLKTRTCTESRVIDMTVTPSPNWYAMSPLRVLWAGTLLSTAAYAYVAWGVLWAIGALRRTRSRRCAALVGCCTHCGYNLSGLVPGVPCPECGREGCGGTAT